MTSATVRDLGEYLSGYQPETESEAIDLLVQQLDHLRRVAGENADLYAREREIRLDYENVCAGLICPDCGAEPIKVGHGANGAQCYH